MAIETSRGLSVACLRATGRAIYAINPLAASRYRERHSVARAKSDHADAVMLANIVRTDAVAHRRLPADTELVQAIAVLARAGQDAAWNRQQPPTSCGPCCGSTSRRHSQRSKKLKYGLASVEARTVLAAAPTPERARALTEGQLRKLLIKAGRQRRIEVRVERLHQVFRAEQMHQLASVERAFGEQARAVLGLMARNYCVGSHLHVDCVPTLAC